MVGEEWSDNHEISYKAISVEHFSSLFVVTLNLRLISWKKHCHDGAFPKDD